MKIQTTRNYSVNITKTIDLEPHVGENKTWESIEELWDDADLDLPVPPSSEWTMEQIDEILEVTGDWDSRDEEWPDSNGELIEGKIL
jgi:hypothetical protein